MKRPHLISVDELRAAGALDVPASWRKSLGGGPHRQLDLFSGQLADDDADNGSSPDDQNGDMDDDESDDELS